MHRSVSSRWLRATLAGLLCAGLSSAQQFANGSFESWGGSNCEINSAPDGWQKFLAPGLNSGLGVDEGRPSVCPHTIPSSVYDGLGYARAYALSTGGEGISQAVSGFVPGRTYRVQYRYAGSNVYGGVTDGYWQSYVDGAVVDTGPTYGSLTPTWSERSFEFVATQTTHTIGFLGFAASTQGSASLAIDAASISDASVWTYGAACSVGSPLQLDAGLPLLGATWTLQASGIENVGSLAVFWFGDEERVPPIDLVVVGAAGCFAHNNVNLGAFVTSASAGAASYALPIPATTALSGTQLFVQMSAASNATPVGFTTSNGVGAVLGG